MLPQAIIDESTSSLISSVREKVLSFIRDKVVFNPTANLPAPEYIMDLLASAYSAVKTNDYFSSIPKEDMESLFSDNLEMIIEWIFNPEQNTFTDENIKIPNYDYEKQCKGFIRGVYNYLIIEHNRYRNPLIGFTNVSNQVLQLQNGQNQMMNMQLQAMQMLQTLQANLQLSSNNTAGLSFQNELVQIDDCIKVRKYNEAIRLLNFIKEKILQNGSGQEKEKLYVCYSSVYLQQLPINKEKLCAVLKELVKYTLDETNRLYRTALLYIHEGKIDDALRIINENASKKPDIFLDIKAYILFTQNKYEELLKFLETVSFTNKNVWKVRALLNSHNLEKAYEVLQNNKQEFEQDFETQVLKNHICCYYLLGQKDKIFTDTTLLEKGKTVLDVITSSIESSADDTYLRSELLADKMMLELLLKEGDIKGILDKLNELGSTNPNYLRNKALYDLSIREFKKSFEEFDSYCKEYPEDEVAKELRAMALYEYNPQLAIDELSKLEDSLENISQKIKIVYAHFVLLQYEEAFNVIKELERNTSKSFYIYNAYGDYYLQVQDFAKAFENYSKALNCKDGEINKVDTFGRMMQIAIPLQNIKMVDECINRQEHFPRKALLECYSYELISLYIVKKDFDSALKCIEEYKTVFSTNPKINYLELLCYHDSGRNEEVINCFNTDNNGLADEMVQQKLKMLVAACQKIGNTKKAQEIFHLIKEPKTEEEFVEKINAAKALELEKECLQCAMDAYQKYPDSFKIIETLLYVFTNRKDHSFDNNMVASTIFKECLSKYEKVPEDKRNLLFVRLLDLRGE